MSDPSGLTPSCAFTPVQRSLLALCVRLHLSDRDLIEGYMKGLFKEILNVDIPTPFDRMLYWDAMDRYGSDKPDLRISLELCDVAAVFAESSFEPFKALIAKGGVVRGLALPGGAALSRKETADLEEKAKKFGASGLAVFQLKDGVLKGPLVKFLSGPEQDRRRVLPTSAGAGGIS